jgi:glycine/D-amino acid oxidase-like deaminating enzyme
LPGRTVYRPAIDVVIVGAGTFGASLAWWLTRTGERVTLVDQFEPGDARSSSGGETRLYRCAHGPDADYTAMARRARTLWRELEDESGEEVLIECGLAWFAHRDDGWEAESERTLAAQDIPAERLDLASAAELYPSFRSDDLAFVLLEPEGGVLRGQLAVRALAAQAAAHGARIVRGRARPDGGTAVLDDASRLEGDLVVWACGPWLGRLFPDLVALSVTRQELLFFDGGPAWRAPDLPSWCDYDRARYGTADIDGLGVKAAIDDLGPPLDPDAELGDEATTEAEVRAYLHDRFPALEHARLVEARSCRYELTPDTHFIAAPHPEHPRVWLVGAGSGHGFKHGPPMAERLALTFREGTTLPGHFALGERQPSAGMRTASSGVPAQAPG